MTSSETTVAGQRFNLGTTVITCGALTHCEDNAIDYLELIMRHAAGDFGTVGLLDNANLTRAERQHGEFMTDDGLKLNAVAIESQQGMVMSIYPSPEAPDSKLWIQTLLAGDATTTTILRPQDY